MHAWTRGQDGRLARNTAPVEHTLMPARMSPETPPNPAFERARMYGEIEMHDFDMDDSVDNVAAQESTSGTSANGQVHRNTMASTDARTASGDTSNVQARSEASVPERSVVQWQNGRTS